MIDSQLDCIVRFHNSRRLCELKRCFFSLYGRYHRPLNVIVVTQRFTGEEIDVLEREIGELRRLHEAPSFTIRNWEHPAPKDARTELLNLGSAAATGRYLAFLDYDDVLYPEACSTLVARLRETRSAIAFAKVRVVGADVFPEFVRVSREVVPPFSGEDLSDLFRANFCPLHSYLIDRSVIPEADLQFDVSLTWEEDYDLLLRVCARYGSDFSARGMVIGDYYHKTDGSNSVPVDGAISTERAREYEKVSALIEVRRRTTKIAEQVQAKLGLLNTSPGMTIREALDAMAGSPPRAASL